MGDIFEDAYRSIQVDETDYNSPDNETTYAQVRINLETLIAWGAYTGDSGTATQDPPNDTTGVLTDSGASYSVDEHNGRLLIIIDGLAKGNVYEIDDTTATTLIATGDNLYSDGVRSGDSYKVFYNFLSGEGHTHDGLDSPNVTLEDASIATAKYQDNSVTIEKLEHGSLSSLPVCGYGDGIALTLTATTSFTAEYTGKIYVPANATTLKAIFYYDVPLGGSNCQTRFTVDGNGSSAANTNSSSKTWSSQVSLDCSSISGLVTITIDLKAQAARTLTVYAWTFWWE